MFAAGSWTNEARQRPTRGIFTFWGEWEPQSEVRRLTLKKQVHCPQWLHIPRLNLDELARLTTTTQLSCNTMGAQNTDPLVFGDRFRYVLCQQYRKSGPTKLASLSRGDVILFGSHSRMLCARYGLRCRKLRTCATWCVLPDWESDLHRRITMDLIEIPDWGLRLYGSEAWSRDKPFSFVPCLPAQRAPRGFGRPVLEPLGPLEAVISPGQKQGFKAAQFEEQDARLVWEAVVKQVIDQGCALATTIDGPSDRAPSN